MYLFKSFSLVFWQLDKNVETNQKAIKKYVNVSVITTCVYMSSGPS